MLGGKALENWSKIRTVEPGHMVRAMYESSQKVEVVVELEMLMYAIANMMGQVILSRRFFTTKGSESNEFKDMVVELMTSAGMFNIGDFIPSIAWMDLQGIEETFRKHPPTPLNLPRVSTQACQINGYYIPKNTRLSVNIWAIGRDADVWDNPLDFNPERFLSGKNAKIDPPGNDFELIPLGAGRRICAGTRMGKVLVEYMLGTLVHSFDWMVPPGTAELNMDEAFGGLALQKVVPLSACLRPRLATTAYVSTF
ncbi:hypothetical protein V6N13_113743 [Hibiscus sabdariffa]|uniref:Flavonoid 3',5'-hydroxylase n=1 Tax=Hibiscus sabdariffa TaxID=183260 RepID=A0ABR2U019_9ROSI